MLATMSATDVSDTLQVALQGSGLNQVIILRDGVVIDGGPVNALRGSHEDIVRSIYL
jgi:hypothetical protein